MWMELNEMELNEMELNGREDQLNLTTSIEKCTSPHFTVAASMAHMKVKWSNKGKGTEKWCKILMIAEGKMSLSQVAKSK